ncbi:MAG: hypothetical protein H6714_02410 [Myxococcales bacterium]|nr:hypothetical protein [Myxococcales bacterium]
MTWIGLAVLRSTLALPVPEVTLDAPLESKPKSATVVPEQSVSVATRALKAAEKQEIRTAPSDQMLFTEYALLGDLLKTFKEGIVLYEEGSPKTSQFTVELLRGPVWSSMSASVSF